MCGICGQYNFKDHSPVIPENIKRMTRTMVHRGPDEEGFYFSGPIGFGFRRLSIIDIEGGSQPMSDTEKSVFIVFNGEIYNFPELKNQLQHLGHQFQTNSDTEVIVYGYKQWGIHVLSHLQGMFGLAIWDERKKQLFLARDSMGIKLLYYKIEDGNIYFASEIRAILSVSNKKPEVDPVSLNLFLRYRYTPSPRTLFKGIKKLAPGTLLTFSGCNENITRWYNYKPIPFNPMPSIMDAQEMLTDLYTKSVKRHLLSDVPVGLLLSGGIDSGLLLAMMNLHGSSWPTFTIGYGKDYEGDELTLAEKTASFFSAKHISVKLSKNEFEINLPKIVSFLEEPVATSSIVPMYFVSKRAHQDVKVALIGQGPDELFGGYLRHLGIRYGAYWRNSPTWLVKAFIFAIKMIPNETLNRGAYSLHIKKRMKRYQNVFSIMPQETVNGLFLDGILDSDAGDQILECWQDLSPLMENTDELGGFQFLEIRSSLPDELLMYADKLSMAHSLEVRVPYLDREIVEFVEKLNAGFKIRNGARKWLHKRICTNFLPKSIINRKKRGFADNVMDRWFNETLSKKMESFFLDDSSLMFQYLNPDIVRQLLFKHRTGKEKNQKILFSLVVFEEWLRSGVSQKPNKL